MNVFVIALCFKILPDLLIYSYIMVMNYTSNDALKR